VVLELLKAFGPELVEWVRRLLLESARSRKDQPSQDSDVFRGQLAEVFATARRGLWWWQFRRRAALAVLERAAVRQSAYVRSVAAKTPFVTLPGLWDEERRELESALKGG
jgi:hypothetical protein